MKKKIIFGQVRFGFFVFCQCFLLPIWCWWHFGSIVISNTSEPRTFTRTQRFLTCDLFLRSTVSPEKLLEMRSIRTHHKHTESDTLKLRPTNCAFNQEIWVLLKMIKFERQSYNWRRDNAIISVQSLSFAIRDSILVIGLLENYLRCLY